MTRARTSAAVALALTASGCGFSRSVVNPHCRDLDTSWIIPGETARAEVVARLGMPPTAINGGGGVRKDTMRWVSLDGFTGRFEAGYIVTPTFEVSREHHRHDILVRFDDAGIVKLVSRTESVGGKNRIIEFREAP